MASAPPAARRLGAMRSHVSAASAATAWDLSAAPLANMALLVEPPAAIGDAEVRKTPSWPRSRANFSLL
jgi:hypothetical protein